MNSDTLKTLLYVGMGAAAVYFIYQAISKVGAPLVNAVGAGVNAATSGIANAYVGLTSGPGAQLSAAVLMPDGSNFPAGNLSSMGVQSGAGSLTFQSGGQTYSLSPADANGNYVAQPLSGLGGYRRRTFKRER